MTALPQLPIFHLPPAPYVSLFHVQFFCSSATFSSTKPHQVPRQVPRQSQAHQEAVQGWDTESLTSLRHSSITAPLAWGQGGLSCCAPQAALGDLLLPQGHFLFLGLFGRFPKGGWAQFLVHHTAPGTPSALVRDCHAMVGTSVCPTCSGPA